MNKKLFLEKINFIKNNTEKINFILKDYLIKYELKSVEKSFNDLTYLLHNFPNHSSNYFSCTQLMNKDKRFNYWLEIQFNKFIQKKYYSEQGISIYLNNSYLSFIEFMLFILDELYNFLEIINIRNVQNTLQHQLLINTQKALKTKLVSNDSRLSWLINSIGNMFEYWFNVNKHFDKLLKYSKYKYSDKNHFLNEYLRINKENIKHSTKNIKQDLEMTEDLLKLVNSIEDILFENLRVENYELINNNISKHNLYKVLSKFDLKFNLVNIDNKCITYPEFIDSLHVEDYKIESISLFSDLKSIFKGLGDSW